MIDIKEQLEELNATYEAIAKRLEDLVELMNQKVGEAAEIKQNAVRIIGFLKRLMELVESTRNFVGGMIKKNKPLETSIEDLYNTLRDLSTFLGVVAKKGNGDLLIRKIAKENEDVKRILDEQKALLHKSVQRS